MATVTKSIGTSSRDYSTINAWEADLNSGSIYSNGDTAVGEMYADSTFTGATSTIENGSAIGGSAVGSAAGNGGDPVMITKRTSGRLSTSLHRDFILLVTSWLRALSLEGRLMTHF